MSELHQIIGRYSAKYDRTIKKICSPLADCLGIPAFTYVSIEADGRFGYIDNHPEFADYYFRQDVHLTNPYFAHPALFRSGYAFIPCTLDDEVQKSLTDKFQANHIFVSLQSDGTRTEMFIFTNYDVSESGSQAYLSRLDLLAKFSRYFKREARDLLGKMRAEQFSIAHERGREFDLISNPVPLAYDDPQIFSFLKRVSGLSPQEQRCLELFKKGNSAQATAAIMGLSQRTVESYFESIKNKLGCTSKYDLLEH